MPIIRVEMYEGRTPEQKRALVQELTSACVRAVGVPPASVVVLLTDVAKHDWATGGTLASDAVAPPKA
jgi:4-oxalocrotonate tautomerase